jgi:hypothetical protein
MVRGWRRGGAGKRPWLYVPRPVTSSRPPPHETSAASAPVCPTARVCLRGRCRPPGYGQADQSSYLRVGRRLAGERERERQGFGEEETGWLTGESGVFGEEDGSGGEMPLLF